MKREYLIGVAAVVVIILVIFVARYYKNEEFAPVSSSESNDSSDSNDSQIVENFPSAPQNVLTSDASGNLKATSDLGLQFLTISNNGALLIGDKFRFNSNKDNWADDEWLRMSNKDNTGYYGGFATTKVWTQEIYGAPVFKDGNLNVAGGKLLEGGNALVPRGTIVMFNGAAPAGWAICDGKNGTPDLRNRFIVGAGSSYGVGTTGGADTVTLTVEQMPKHTHGYDGMSGGYWRCDNDNEQRCSPDSYAGTTGSAGGDQPHENRPPFYALTYIMKL